MTSSGKVKGYALHVATASGAVVAMLALQAMLDGRTRAALTWLVVTQVLDGLDGPIARRWDVTLHAPRVDGYILDLVVDYVTCVVVPVVFLEHLGLLPPHGETWIAGAILLSSALWFARTDMETEDFWFNGFPAAWNLAVPTFFLAHMTTAQVAVVSIVLCISQLTTIKVPHIVRAPQLRWCTLPFGAIYVINLSYLSFAYSETLRLNWLTGGILAAFPVYVMAISVWRTWVYQPA